jgi:hypothetical protein
LSSSSSFFSVTIKDDDERPAHRGFLLFFPLARDDNNKSRAHHHLMILCSLISKNDIEPLAHHHLSFCFYAPKENNEECWLVVVFKLCKFHKR